jgi:hypothetical protein
MGCVTVQMIILGWTAFHHLGGRVVRLPDEVDTPIRVSRPRTRGDVRIW